VNYPDWLGPAIAAMLVGAWGAWKLRRNSLPDDEREKLFWNDQRYEALQRWITRGLWISVAILAAAVAAAYGSRWLE
jgi:hypothetical protein